MAKRIKPKFKGLAAILSALEEGAMSREEVDSTLDAVRMGIGLSKRDKALGLALEQTGDAKDGPAYWDGFRAGLVEGYEGARRDYEAGVKLRPVEELAKEAQSETKGEPN